MVLAYDFDGVPPVLVSLVIPKTVNLSKGTANLTISGVAIDDMSGVGDVVVWLDKNIAYSFSPSGSFPDVIWNFLGMYGFWPDGKFTGSWGIMATNSSGIYSVEQVTVDDLGKNRNTYTKTVLTEMGVNTVIEFVGSAADAKLTMPWLPFLLDDNLQNRSQ